LINAVRVPGPDSYRDHATIDHLLPLQMPGSFFIFIFSPAIRTMTSPVFMTAAADLPAFFSSGFHNDDLFEHCQILCLVPNLILLNRAGNWCHSSDMKKNV